MPVKTYLDIKPKKKQENKTKQETLCEKNLVEKCTDSNKNLKKINK